MIAETWPYGCTEQMCFRQRAVHRLLFVEDCEQAIDCLTWKAVFDCVIVYKLARALQDVLRERRALILTVFCPAILQAFAAISHSAGASILNPLPQILDIRGLLLQRDV